MPACAFKAQALQNRTDTAQGAGHPGEPNTWAGAGAQANAFLAESTQVAMRCAVSNPPRRWHAGL